MQGRMTLHWEGAFDSAHRLYQYDGKCAHLHGHRWNVKVDISIDTMDYPKDGISVDFNVLKNLINGLDHKYLNEDFTEFSEDGVGLSPSAENIVQFLADEIEDAIKDCKGNPHVKRVELFETPNNSVVIEF